MNRFVKFFIYITQLREQKAPYYKSANITGQSGCVEAMLSSTLAKKLNAIPGKCSDLMCNTYKGEHKLPLCCKLQCFTCDDYL